MSDNTRAFSSVSSITLPVEIIAQNQTIQTTALLDSGAVGNFIDSEFVGQLHLELTPCNSSLAVEALDGRPLDKGRILRLTVSVTLRIGTLHSERIQFYVIRSPTHLLILGLPWLRTHDPQISWREGQITEWGPTCQERCLSKITRNPSPTPTSTSDAISLPPEYADLVEVFSKRRASQLPIHRSVDCAIDLLPDTTPPKGRIFPLSQPESESMKTYIKEELAKGFIRPSTSPASAGFFFVKRKDGGLRPCIDYQGLNENTVKFRYPLPLVPSALEQLRQARYYTKLDLRNAYNLIRIREGDEWKTAFSTTSGHYEYLVMPFGLANSPSVFQAFMNDIFRDMELRNYDVGNRELLAMKLALEEGRHWLEGTTHPFTVLTDHKNLEYLRSAKRLNPRQARWALFFTRFQFTVTYRPGTKNTKADALSRQAEGVEHSSACENILPERILLAPIQWDIMTEIAHANRQTQPPPECPADLVFVPEPFRDSLLLQVHASPSSGHPGVTATEHLLRNRFWWPTLLTDTTHFIRNCNTCNITKSLKQLPAGLLQPLPTPRRPWSHIAINLISSQTCPTPKVTQLFSPLSTAFPKPAASYLCLNCLLPSRQLNYYATRCFAITAYPMTSSPTVAPSSRQGYGQPSLRVSTSMSVSPPATIHSPTARPSVSTRRSSTSFAPTVNNNRRSGVDT